MTFKGLRAGVGDPPRRDLILSSRFFDDLEYWVQEDGKIAQRLLRLVRITWRDPFHGPGKPEPLKGGTGLWSRRLTSEHRFVYRVSATAIECAQARFHY